MPAKTPEQRKLFGAALAAKRGAKPISKKVADIAAKTSEKELSKMASKPKKKAKKENVNGVCDPMYLVRKPHHGIEQDQLVMPLDPLQGLAPLNVMQNDVHSVVPDEREAQRIAAEVYSLHQKEVHALEEKKHHITEKIKAVMKKLEKERAECNEMIRENPKDSANPRQKVAELTHKLDELVNTLERIEKSKKHIEKEEKTKKHDKKKLKEALKKALMSK